MNHPTSTTPSNTPTTTQRAGIVAHALRALADHIEEHHLPEPGSIDIESDHLEFAIQGDDVAVWAASLGKGVDSLDTIREGRGVRACRAEGRLPNSGVRVAFEWVWIVRGNSTVPAVTR